MARPRVRNLLIVGLLAGAVLTGCSDDDPAPDPGGTASPDAAATVEPDGGSPSAEGAEDSTPEVTDGAGEDPDEGAGDDDTEGADESPASGSLAVEVEGEGPFGLLTADGPDGEAQDYSGMLIAGPGGCLAMEDDAPPQVLVFADGAELVLHDARPSVTTSGLGTVRVGEDFDVTAVPVPVDAVDGLPDECAAGAQDEVLVVTE
ncbi:hypothetical protein UQW22_08080 [Isoptericola halotolerans]|uniref:hypothetical protein n=1 Tax=Isoptericola halotolerans TaxID=300560 RepID=UPI00388DD934